MELALRVGQCNNPLCEVAVILSRVVIILRYGSRVPHQAPPGWQLCKICNIYIPKEEMKWRVAGAALPEPTQQ